MRSSLFGWRPAAGLVRPAVQPGPAAPTVAGLSRFAGHRGLDASLPLTAKHRARHACPVFDARGAAEGPGACQAGSSVSRLGWRSALFLYRSFRAANILEKNFWLSGPRYDREMPTVRLSSGPRPHHRRFPHQGGAILEFTAADRRHREYPAKPPYCLGPRKIFRAAFAAEQRSSTTVRGTRFFTRSRRTPV